MILILYVYLFIGTLVLIRTLYAGAEDYTKDTIGNRIYHCIKEDLNLNVIATIVIYIVIIVIWPIHLILYK